VVPTILCYLIGRHKASLYSGRPVAVVGYTYNFTSDTGRLIVKIGNKGVCKNGHSFFHNFTYFPPNISGMNLNIV
jgi:hypothetical protein